MHFLKSAAVSAALLAGSTAIAAAQDGSIEFRMAAAKNNIAGCMAMDAALSRVHTVTVTGDKAVMKSAGGISDTLKQTAPGIYTTSVSLNGVRLDVVANAGVSPRTLTIKNAQRGCEWDAIAP